MRWDHHRELEGVDTWLFNTLVKADNVLNGNTLLNSFLQILVFYFWISNVDIFHFLLLNDVFYYLFSLLFYLFSDWLFTAAISFIKRLPWTAWLFELPDCWVIIGLLLFSVCSLVFIFDFKLSLNQTFRIRDFKSKHVLECHQSPQMDQGEHNDKELEPCAGSNVGALISPPGVLLPVHDIL